MEIPDDLLCLFSSRIEQRDGSVVIDVPAEELDHGDISVGNVYRIAILSGVEGTERERPRAREEPAREPPVQEGDRRTVEIEGIGDQGDGIAKVDRGYVVIVPGTNVGDEVTVEIEDIYPNFAMAHVVEATDRLREEEEVETDDSPTDPIEEPASESAVDADIDPSVETEAESSPLEFDTDDDGA